MSAQLKTRRVELTDPDKKRGIHSVYAPDTTLGRDDAGNAKQTTQTHFLRGRADVDETRRRQLKDAGVVK